MMDAKEVLRFVYNKLSFDENILSLRAPSLRINFLWTLVGNCTYAASQWGILILISKLGTIEMVGKFALALAITAPVIIFSNLALRAVQATDASNTYEFGHYLALRLVTTSGALLIIVGVAVFLHYSWSTTLVILMVGLAKSFESISDVIYGLLQQHEWMDKISISMILKSFLSLLGVAVGLFLGKSLFWGMVGLATAWGLTLMAYDQWIGKMLVASQEATSIVNWPKMRLKPLWNREKVLSLVWVTLPLGIATSMVSLNVNIPRYFLERSFGEHDLGIFAALAYPLTAGMIIINALGQSASPRLANYFESGNVKKFWNLLLILTLMGLLIGLAVIILVQFFGVQLLSVFYQAEYASYEREFFWLAIAACVEFTFAFMGYGMTAAHYFKIQPVIYFISITLSIGLGYLLIPANGILGAIQVLLITTCFRSISMMGVNIYALRKRTLMKSEILNEAL